MGAHPLSFEERADGRRPLDCLDFPISDDDPLHHDPAQVRPPGR